MPKTMCRVAIHNDGNTIDLALPSTVDLGELLPSIVEIVCDDHDAVAAGRRWRLHRSGGDPLDESLTLRQNRVDDGELLWLTADDPPPFRWTERDACHVVAQVADTGELVAYVPIFVSIAAAAAGAGALLWSAHWTDDTPWLLGAGLSSAAMVGAVATRRTSRSPQLSLACGLIAVLFAAVAGVAAVPAGPVAAHLLLASAAAFSVSASLLRLTGDSRTMTTLATLTLLATLASMCGVMWGLRPAELGATLVTLSLGAVTAAPRMAIALSRIAPTIDDTCPANVDEPRAKLAHTTMTGLLAGSSSAAVVGASLVAYGQAISERAPLAAITFTAVVGVVLTLRARTHPDPVRRCALLWSGSLVFAASFAVTVIAVPHAAHWLSILAVTAAAGALAPLLGLGVGPTAERTADIVEYAALAAVIPLACWVGGIYRLVRDSALM